MPRLAGKTALISGAARGIGAACGPLLHDEGATVVLGDLLAEEAHRVASPAEYTVDGGLTGMMPAANRVD